MILSDIKNYLIEHKRASLTDLSNHFGTEPAAMQGMLGHWIRKGQIHRIEMPSGNCSGTCVNCCCDGASLEIYEWR